MRSERSSSGRSGGFSLIEVMAAVLLLAVSLTIMLQLRNRAIEAAIDGRSLSIASRLGLQLLHRIEAGRVADLFDGYIGDFSAEGFPQFSYVIGLGDGSSYSQGIGERDAEQAWRLAKQKEYEESLDQEGEQVKPALTRVFITVNYPGRVDEEQSYQLETLIPTWAVEQDLDLYEALWAGNLPAEIE